jgi:glycosyltransferase involved in cell wall biosynthesis
VVQGRVSCLVPSRNEQFLVPTVKGLLDNARGDLELIVVLDGYWEHNLPADQRIRILHHGQAQGMRAAINHAVQMSTGSHLLKCDAHTLWDEGYDVKLHADYHEDDWIMVPRRYALDPDAWAIDPSNRKYPIDYHYLAEPFAAYGDSTPGLHGTAWTARRDERKAIALDDEMTSQGSAWFMSRACWDRLGPQDAVSYGSFWHEFQEIGLKAWLSGGAVKVTKNTWYAHLYKGKRYGRGYSTRNLGHEAGTAFCSWFWMTDQPFRNRTRSFRWLLERFWPVPTWPGDLDAVFRRAHDELRNPYVAAA